MHKRNTHILRRTTILHPQELEAANGSTLGLFFTTQYEVQELDEQSSCVIQ